MAHPMELASRPMVCAAALRLASWSLALAGAVPWDDAGGAGGVAVTGCRCRGVYGTYSTGWEEVLVLRRGCTTRDSREGERTMWVPWALPTDADGKRLSRLAVIAVDVQQI